MNEDQIKQIFDTLASIQENQQAIQKNLTALMEAKESENKQENKDDEPTQEKQEANPDVETPEEKALKELIDNE